MQGRPQVVKGTQGYVFSIMEVIAKNKREKGEKRGEQRESIYVSEYLTLILFYTFIGNLKYDLNPVKRVCFYDSF